MCYQPSQKNSILINDPQPRLQAFRERSQPHSEPRYIIIEQDEHHRDIIYWNMIEQRYEDVGIVQYVADGADHIAKHVGLDMQIIMPERISAYPEKILEVAFEGEYPGGPLPETSEDIGPIRGNEDPESDLPSSSFSPSSKSSNGASLSSPSDYSMSNEVHDYPVMSVSHSSSLLLPCDSFPIELSSCTTATSPDNVEAPCARSAAIQGSSDFFHLLLLIGTIHAHPSQKSKKCRSLFLILPFVLHSSHAPCIRPVNPDGTRQGFIQLFESTLPIVLSQLELSINWGFASPTSDQPCSSAKANTHRK